MSKRKVILVRFEFKPEEWEHIRRYYRESDVRQILFDGAEGELDGLLAQKEEDDMQSEEPDQEERPWKT